LRQLANWVALVTGGGTGIGRAIALAFADQGARVCVCGRRPEPIASVKSEIESGGGRCLAIEADVSDQAQVEHLVRSAEDALGPIRILVNNAGIGGGGDIHEHGIEDWDRVMAVNLRGPFLMSRAVLPGMRARHQGHIIQISSESGLEYYEGSGAYGIGKHALNDLGEYIQRENQEYGIRVDTICPGMVVTEMTQNSAGLDHSKCLFPEDIADLVLWLVTRRPNIKIGNPILIQTMLNPWE
jgi:NAD(P)-dependent dehydrogenase (short-subunit alcohol dehydrogenase family)